MFTVKIDDGFCEWEYKLKHTNPKGYSIRNVLEAIITTLNFEVVAERMINAHPLPEILINHFTKETDNEHN